MYNSASVNITKSLDTIQNQCLRICTGTRQTTPICSLEVESHVPSLSFRRNFLALKYFSKIHEMPSETPVVCRLKSYYNSIIKHKGYFNSVIKLTNNWQITPCTFNAVSLYTPRPPWMSLDDLIRNEFTTVPVAVLDPLTAQTNFNELISKNYSTHCQIYTDGSKSELFCGSAYTIPKMKTSASYSLPINCSVLTSELYAIDRAALYASIFLKNIYCVILTDSLSAVNLLRSAANQSFNGIKHKILDTITLSYPYVSIQWIPGHKGIVGNEKADKLAKSVMVESNVSKINLNLPMADRVRVIKNCLMRKWRESWEEEAIVRRRETALYEIKTNIEKWPWASCRIRALETSLARLRVGHAGLAAHLFRFNMADAPLCECGEIETVQHFLLQCSRYDEARHDLHEHLKLHGIDGPLTNKLLLGGENLSNEKQFIIQRLMHQYLVKCQRLFSL